MFQQVSNRFMFGTANNSLYTIENEELQQIRYIEYLLGYSVSGMGRLYAKTATGRLPLLASPFRRHLNSVSRFLFSGGVIIDVANAKQNDPRQCWINSMIKHIDLQNVLETLWERGPITGELFISVVQNADIKGRATEYFDVQVYEKADFEAKYDDYGNLAEVCVTTVRNEEWETDGREEMRDVVHKMKFTSEAYEVWDPVPLERARLSDFGEPTVTPHSYGEVPGVIFRNSKLATSLNARGETSFNIGAIETAVEIAVQMVDAAESFHYFGHQMIISPDVKGTLKALQERTRVLRSFSEVDGGKTGTLDMKPMPDGHADFIARMEENLMESLGTPIVSDRVSGDASSLTLRLLNAPIIDTAESKWGLYVDSGLEPLFSLMLRMAAFEGILGNVNPMDPTTSEVTLRRKLPYFSPTPAEKQQSLAVAETLVSLGVRKEVALAREYFTNLTEEEVLGMLEGDF